MAKVQILTNIPEFLTFKFNTWKRWDNQGQKGPYVTYSIGVEHKGVDEYFTVYEREYNEVFSKLGNLQGRTLEVGKFQDGKYVNWSIKENGADITPQRSYGAPQAPTSHTTPQSIQTPTPQQNQAPQLNFEPHQFVTKNMLNEIMDKQRKAFREMDKITKEVTRQLEYIKEMMKTNQNSWEMHKDMLTPLEKPIERQEETDPEIPIVGNDENFTKNASNALGI